MRNCNLPSLLVSVNKIKYAFLRNCSLFVIQMSGENLSLLYFSILSLDNSEDVFPKSDMVTSGSLLRSFDWADERQKWTNIQVL